MGSSRWVKAKAALKVNMCMSASTTSDNEEASGVVTGRGSEATVVSESVSSLAVSGSNYCLLPPSTPTPTSSGLRSSKSGRRTTSKSIKEQKTCAICLGSMRPGQGQALFTAECSHTFHFNCIVKNVKHGNKVCPNCRAKWKEVPLNHQLTSEFPLGPSQVNPLNTVMAQDDVNRASLLNSIFAQNDRGGHMTLLRRPTRSHSSNRSHQLHRNLNLFHVSEPDTYDDDEPLDSVQDAENNHTTDISEEQQKLDVTAYPEFSPISKSASENNFSVLIHLKAPFHSQNSRAPVDLVTVLDISGSMSGSKLVLLKRAMSFVIQNLGPSDRLSIVSFSSTARRLFHLRKMNETGKQQSLQAVNSLTASGGTNIAEGLRKGFKAIEERREKNPVCCIVLLSDGEDTYTINSSDVDTEIDYKSLLPSSVPLPIHAFGFGSDHDARLMHSVSDGSGGTYSFIEDEGVIQDAFAQCIGGILSVVVQDLKISIECVHPAVRLDPIKSGGYLSCVASNGRKGSINVGDLYADEERGFLVSVNIPPVSTDDNTTLLKVNCFYRDTLSKDSVSLLGEALRIERPDAIITRNVSIEVDREKNRIRAADAMTEARAAAEQGILSEAVSILETCRRVISESLSGRGRDRVCVALDAELNEVQERMASRQRYEYSGRAYVLSGLSSHSWQRATARGDSTDTGSLVTSYQTPSMVDMVTRSQVLDPLPRSATVSQPSKSSSFSLPLVPDDKGML